MSVSPGARAALAILATVLLAALAFAFLRPGTDSKPEQLSDAANVLCDSKTNRAEVVEAGLALGSLVEGSSTGRLRNEDATFASFDHWQERRPAEYAEACRNAIAALQLRRGGSSPTQAPSPLIPLLGVAVGSVLTLLSTEWKAARDRLRARAEVLRTAIVIFDSTVRQYVHEWQARPFGAPSVEGLRETSSRLAALLGQALREHDSAEGWSARSRLEEFATGLGSDNWPPPGEERKQFIQDELRQLQDLVRDLHSYASEWERRALQRNSMPSLRDTKSRRHA